MKDKQCRCDGRWARGSVYESLPSAFAYPMSVITPRIVPVVYRRDVGAGERALVVTLTRSRPGDLSHVLLDTVARCRAIKEQR